MSKLAKAIDYHTTGNLSAIQNFGYKHTEIYIHTHDNIPKFAREYKIEVKLSAVKWFDPSALIDTGENEPAIRKEVYSTVKRAMIEEVFGEFRPLIIELQSAIYDKNLDRMRQLTAELEHKMFVEGL
jgi:hypothetical protein